MVVCTMPAMRIALAHDWLVGMRGGERVLDRIVQPVSDLRTELLKPAHAETPLLFCECSHDCLP